MRCRNLFLRLFSTRRHCLREKQRLLRGFTIVSPKGLRPDLILGQHRRSTKSCVQDYFCTFRSIVPMILVKPRSRLRTRRNVADFPRSGVIVDSVSTHTSETSDALTKKRSTGISPSWAGPSRTLAEVRKSLIGMSDTLQFLFAPHDAVGSQCPGGWIVRARAGFSISMLRTSRASAPASISSSEKRSRMYVIPGCPPYEMYDDLRSWPCEISSRSAYPASARRTSIAARSVSEV
jgi:hypothetical protein